MIRNFGADGSKRPGFFLVRFRRTAAGRLGARAFFTHPLQAAGNRKNRTNGGGKSDACRLPIAKHRKITEEPGKKHF